MKILLTSSGFQGGYNLVRFLQSKGFEIIGTDMNPNSAARFYCDRFYQVPPATNSSILARTFLEICKKELPDVILPAGSYDTFVLSHIKDLPIKLMVSNPQLVDVCINKFHTYEALKRVIELPKYIYNHLGYYKKPLAGKGNKGIDFISGEDTNQRYLIMEKLEGEQIDVDVLSWKGKLLVAECKTRERAYGGTLMEGEIVDRPEIVKQIKKALKVIPLDYLSVWQFIGRTFGKLLEINPRIAGAIIDFNLPLMAIQLALKQISPNQIKKYKVPIGKKVARYMTQIEYE